MSYLCGAETLLSDYPLGHLEIPSPNPKLKQLFG